MAVHPDKQRSERKKQLFTEKMKCLNMAWEKIMRSIPPEYKASGRAVTPADTQAALNHNRDAWDLNGHDWSDQDSSEAQADDPSGNEQTGEDSASAGNPTGVAQTHRH